MLSDGGREGMEGRAAGRRRDASGQILMDLSIGLDNVVGQAWRQPLSIPALLYRSQLTMRGIAADAGKGSALASQPLAPTGKAREIITALLALQLNGQAREIITALDVLLEAKAARELSSPGLRKCPSPFPRKIPIFFSRFTRPLAPQAAVPERQVPKVEGNGLQCNG